MKRVMLYFGSFNPIHKGHIALAEYAVEKELCDELVLVVSPQSPYKQAEELAPEMDRFEMAETACAASRYPDRIKPSVVEFLLPHENGEREHFRFEGNIPGNEDNCTEFAEAAAESEYGPRRQRRRDFRQNHPAKDLQPRCAERERGFLAAPVDLSKHGLHRTHNKRNARERHRSDDAEPGVAHLNAKGRKHCAVPSVGSKECRERETRHCSGEHKRQINQPVKQPAPGKPVAHQNPRQKEPQQSVDD